MSKRVCQGGEVWISCVEAAGLTFFEKYDVITHSTQRGGESIAEASMELLIILVRVDAHDAHDAHMTAYLEHKIREHCTLEHHVVLLPEAIPDESALRAAVLEMVEIPLAPALPQVVSLRVQLRTERRRASCAPLAALCQEHTARARACVRKQLPHIAGRRKILKT